MKAQVNPGQKTVVTTEQKAGEALTFTLVVKDPSGKTLEERPLITPPKPQPAPVASVLTVVTPPKIEVAQGAIISVTLRDAQGNILSGRQIVYSCEPASVATVDRLSGVVTAVGEGTATVSAMSEGISDSDTLTVSPIVIEPPPTGDSIAELPRKLPPVLTPPVGGNMLRVNSAADLQAALNAAKPGDTVLLAKGLVLPEEYILPQPPAGADKNTPPIELRTDIPKTLMNDALRRMTPSKAAQLQLAKFIAPSVAPSIRTVQKDNPTRNWILSDIEITGRTPIDTIQYGLLALGDGGWAGGGETQTDLNKMPTGFELDRVYVHGNDTLNCQRGIALNSADTIIRSSWIGDMHARGFDSQAVCGWNGLGPYLFLDCTFEGAGENVMFGGADPGIPGLRPSDITFTNCHFLKPLKWAGQWTIKNPFELKNALRVLLQDCIFDNSWIDAQLGMALVVKSAKGTSGGPAAQGSEDVTFRYCRFRQSHRGINLQGHDEATDIHTKRILIEHCLFEDVGVSNTITPSDGWLMLLTHDLKDVMIRHNTLLGNADGYGIALYMAYEQASNINIIDNVLAGRSYYAMACDGAPGIGTQSINYYTGGNYVFKGNVISQVAAEFQSKHPPLNNYVEQYKDIGLASDGSLLPTSRFKNAATDGTDPGANIQEVLRRTIDAMVAR